jgi:hypothetical protein
MRSKLNKIKLAASIVLALALTFSAVGCDGGNDPKSLAKQGAEATKEAQKLVSEGAKPGDAKFDALQKKTEDLSNKYDNLSEEDKKTYAEEFAKLMKSK